MSVHSTPSRYMQSGGEMHLVPLTTLIRYYKKLYCHELEGSITPRLLDKTRESYVNRMASKIYTYCLLSTLLEFDKTTTVAIIGRAFYLPSSEISLEASGLSRINTGIIKILDLGAFVIDLGGAQGAEITTKDNEVISFIYDHERGDSAVKMHPLVLVSAITILANQTKYAIDSECFPSEFRALPFKPSPQYNQVLREFFTLVKSRNKAHLKSLKGKALYDLKPAVERIAEGSCEYTMTAIPAEYKES